MAFKIPEDNEDEPVELEVGNLQLTFGKHKGERLRDIEPDYLKWLAESKPAVEVRGTNWTVEAAKVLGAGIPPKPKEPEFEYDQFGRMVAVKQEPVRPEIKFDWSNPSCTPKAMADIVDCCLREYVLRLDKKVLFWKWSGNLVQEVCRLGSKKVASLSGTEARIYMDLIWCFSLELEQLGLKSGKYQPLLISVERIQREASPKADSPPAA